jgi:hypothetical protein
MILITTTALIAVILGFFAMLHFAGSPKCPVDRRARVGRGSAGGLVEEDDKTSDEAGPPVRA